MGSVFVTTPEDITTEVSGIWRGESDGAIVKIDLLSAGKSLEVNGNKIPVTVEAVDTDNKIISLKINYGGQDVIWTLRQLYDDDNKIFTMFMTLHDGTQDDLSFVRNL